MLQLKKEIHRKAHRHFLFHTLHFGRGIWWFA